MARTDLYRDSFNNIKKYVDDLFHKIQKGTGDMLKSVYDKNNNGKVDISEISESVILKQKPQSVTETEIKFGVDANGKWGYIKGGADTVTPFKGDPNLQSKTVSPTTSQQIVEPDEGYDGLSEVEINAIPSQGMFEYTFPDRTVSITTNGRHGFSAQTAYDSQTEGYYEGYSLSSGSFTIDVDVPTATLQSNKTVTPSASQQIVTPDSGYDGLEQVTVNAISLQSKSISGMTPTANWSSAYTNAYSISPDSGYTGMSSVSVTVPMVRDYSLFTASAVETPSTVYNGDTAQSNSTKMLRIAPTKTGMVYTNSYLELGPSSLMGNATAADVASGKTFSSSNGIQVTGTAVTPTYQSKTVSPSVSQQVVTPDSGYSALSQVTVNAISGTRDLGTYTTNGTYDRIDVAGFRYCEFKINVNQSGTMQSKTVAPKYSSGIDVTPDSGYDGLSKVTIRPVKDSATSPVIWSNSSPSSTFAGQTITFTNGRKWTDFSAIIIYYKPHRDNTSTYYYAVLLEKSTINAHNNTSTNKFSLCGRASTSASATSGSMYERPFRFASDTTITFGGGTQAGGTGTSNNVMIPVEIRGIY